MPTLSTATAHRGLLYTLSISVIAITLYSIRFAIDAAEMLFMRFEGKTAVACGCTIIPATTHPALLFLVVFASATLLFFSIRILFYTFHTLQSTQSTLRRWNVIYTKTISFFHHTYTLRVISAQQHLLCSSGIFTSTIYISTHTLHTLSTEELRAAVLHEIGHIRHHHPLHTQLTLALTRAFYLDRLSELRAYMLYAHEHTADSFALQFIPRTHVLSAITRLFGAHIQPTTLPQFSLEESRIKTLLGYSAPRTPLSITLTLLAFCITASTSLIPLTLFARSDTLPQTHLSGGGTCAYVEPPEAEYICVQDAGQTLLFNVFNY